MDIDKTIEYYDELDSDGNFEGRRPGHHKRVQYHERERVSEAERRFTTGQDENLRTVAFTYKPARFEEGWLLNSLGRFYEQGWISDVLRKVKGGKEASVYLCSAGVHVDAPLVAAKVYRPRMLRNLKNDGLYRLDRAVLDEDGHPILDLGMLKAHRKRSVYGEQIRHQSWIAYEYQTLQTLQAAGVDVPRPYEMGGNAILMGFIGDETGGAPTLNTVRPGSGERRRLYERLLWDVERMLASGIVHGDLSAYNVLYWDGQVTLIDFPQAVSPAGHRFAWRIFRRDIARLCEYFARLGISNDPYRLAEGLWRKCGYVRRPEVPERLEQEKVEEE
jgi:RIO kinase 1